MIASIVHDPGLVYPDGDEGFSPSERYPEYPFDRVASKPNTVYAAMRRCLAQAGLDAANFGTPAWNPFKDHIRPGNKVFLLCNFVYHRRPTETVKDEHSKCTHASVVRALIDYVRIAAGKDAQVSFGNAPLQACVWERVLADNGVDRLLEFYAREGVKVAAKDLRLFVAERDGLGRIIVRKEREEGNGTLVKLDRDSLLDDLYREGGDVRFRVSDYNPDRTEMRHGLHKHEYIINNEILSSDVVISVPKLKTHEKVGITVGLKGFVGCVGHKDCLAHHRFGPKERSGDEYPDNSKVQIALSRFHDFVYRRGYPKALNAPFEILDKNLRGVAKRVMGKIRSGAWHGNDTAWRMTVDLARIMHYADKAGVIGDALKRRHLAFIDGVVAGEGNGPLAPVPADGKCLVFSDNVVLGDLVACRLMGYDAARIQLIDRASRDPRLLDPADTIRCVLNGKADAWDRLAPVLGRPFVPPVGWKGYLA